MSDPATWDLGRKLHRLLAQCLARRLKSEPTVELLSVARRFLGTQGVNAAAEDRPAVRRISSLYIAALQEALEDGTASGAVLAEAGAFLRSTGALEGLNGRAEAVRAIKDMGDLELPFQ